MLATGLGGPTASWTGKLKIQRLQKTSPNNDRELFEHLSWVEHGWNPHVITSDLSWKPSARSSFVGSSKDRAIHHPSWRILRIVSKVNKPADSKSPKYEVGLSHINHLVLTCFNYSVWFYCPKWGHALSIYNVYNLYNRLWFVPEHPSDSFYSWITWRIIPRIV